MKRYLFHFVIVLSLLLGGAVHLASAQDVGLKAVTLVDASVYETPDAAGEPIGTPYVQHGCHAAAHRPSGAWLEVETGSGAALFWQNRRSF